MMTRVIAVSLACLAGHHALALADESGDFNHFLSSIGLPSEQSDLPLPVWMVSAVQDYGTLTVAASCHTRTPLRIGEKTYKDGLGTHANGRVVFQIESPMETFAADVGIDHNDDTSRGRDKASAVFVVKGDNRELARTPVCRYGQPPQHIQVSIADVRQLELIVTDAGDGISYDQSDWGDARLIDASGKTLQLSAAVALVRALRANAPPASFSYGGQSSRVLLKDWARTTKPPVETQHSRIHEITWLESPTGLAATWHAEVFKDHHALDFRWFFENRGKTPAKPLTSVYALDLQLSEARSFQLIHSTGGLTGPFVPLGEAPAFLISESNLASPVTLSAAGGRSSAKDLPFFQLHHGLAQTGLFVGIGWSGQWQADFRPDAAHGTRVTIEMPNMSLALPPGEKIFSPSVLLGLYRGDPPTGSNALRRILYDRYVALLGDKKPLPPVSWNHWFTFENAVSEDMLKRQADAAADLGLEYFCIDSGWFEGGFPGGVGNWILDRAKFPNGLAPIGKYVADKGMKLGLWFEPARAEPGTRLCREHPDWVDGNRVKMEITEARQWLFHMMCGFIDEGHVQWIRYDYNFDPLAGWDRTDQPETRGLTQIRYLEGEYELFDRLRGKYPDLLIESCSSGGRRIDLETMRRAHTYWKSDETGNLTAARSQETGGNRFLPGVLLNTNLPASSSANCFELHSLFAGPLGFACDWTRLDPPARDRVRQAITAYKTVRHLLNRDYYPLLPQTFDLAQWVGWQFNDPTTGEGFLVILRPQESAYASVEVRLCGIEPDMKYKLSHTDGSHVRNLAGRELLAGLTIPLGRGESEVLRFRRQ
ncbi:MAG: alpha-galactosidase [Phycisphaerae bacterium]|nr:alpha-galactosidase [Phycisphaerae bacterium]